MSTEAPALIEIHDGWAEVVLNRPARRNAITGPLGTALAEALEEASRRSDLRAVVLRGAGGAFCSGLDLDEFRAEPPPAWMPGFQATWRQVHRALFDCPHVLVGALERFAINGGAALALACDVLVAGESSFLQVGEVRMGMGAPYNLAWLRLRHGEAVAARLALVGERIPGPELRQLGIADRVVADAAVLSTAHDVATALAGYPEGSTGRIKRTLRAMTGVGADAWFDRAFASSAK